MPPRPTSIDARDPKAIYLQVGAGHGGPELNCLCNVCGFAWNQQPLCDIREEE